MMKQRFILIILAIPLVFTITACQINLSRATNEPINSQATFNEQEWLNGEDFLPIGSVVSLRNYERKIMIIGVLQFAGDDQSRFFDFAGVAYPEGLIDPNNNYLFDRSQIERIHHLGYIDEELHGLLQVRIRETLENWGN